MNKESSFLEKRENPRINLRLPIHYHLKNCDEDYGIAITKDICLGGVCFLLDRFIAPKTNITMSIFFASRSIYLNGEIVWSANMPHSDRYRLGIKFTGVESDDKKFISDYLSMYLTLN